METIDKRKISYEQMYREAEQIATHLHSNQTYDDIFPYIKHIKDVVDTAQSFGFSGDYIIACFLHDGIEDSRLSYNKIKKIFNENCAELVLSVTNASNLRNRKEKFAATYTNLRNYPHGIIVKLADRIANVEHGIRFESEQLQMYKKEYPEFRDKLFAASPENCKEMWFHLDKLMGYKIS